MMGPEIQANNRIEGFKDDLEVVDRVVHRLLGNNIPSSERTRIFNLYRGYKYIGTDTLGFSGIPAGYRTSSGEFIFAGGYTYFHTTRDRFDGFTDAEYLAYGTDGMGSERLYKSVAYSVRCIKDSE